MRAAKQGMCGWNSFAMVLRTVFGYPGTFDPQDGGTCCYWKVVVIGFWLFVKITTIGELNTGILLSRVFLL